MTGRIVPAPGRGGEWPSRRRLLVLGAAALLVPPAGAGAADQPVPPGEAIRFDLLRDGSPIGEHTVDFRGGGDRLDVESRIEVTVSLLAVALFRYRLHSLETYVGGRLIGFESETVDDDSAFFVKARATTDGLEVRNRKGVLLCPADTLVASYWQRRVIGRDVLLDPQRGRLKPQVVEGRERIVADVAGATRAATRYRLSGVANGEVVYDDADRWIGATVRKKGSDIVYRLRS
jgi:hypothetical protein